MIEIVFEDEQLILKLKGWDIVWTLRRKLQIPFRSIVVVESVDPHLDEIWKGIRLPGAQVLGLIVAGTYYKAGKRTFWDVKRGQEAVFFRLTDHPYDEMTIGVESAELMVQQIRAALPKP